MFAQRAFDQEPLPGRCRVPQSTVRAGDSEAAYAHIQTLPADLRAAIKPFFTHFTSGHTTEMVTARAVADIIAALVAGAERSVPAQVSLAGEWLGLEGVVGAPMALGPDGWTQVFPMTLSPPEADAVRAAGAAIAGAAAATAADA